MDPDANLREALALARAIQAHGFAHDGGNSAEQLSDLLVALDDWIVEGGFLPRRWTKKGD